LILTKCPLRISLAGGSTDLESFIDRFGRGAVISFTPALYTYISISRNFSGVYRINYSRTEETNSVDDIQNDVAREALRYFNVSPVTISFNADIPSSGSGLASSSSYTLSLIKAISMYLNIELTTQEIAQISLELERKFNPTTGSQDVYGCCFGGVKRIDFYPGNKVYFRYLKPKILQDYETMLLNTNLQRNSNDILRDIDILKSYDLLSLVDNMDQAMNDNRSESFFKIINDGWNIKKKTSKLIAGNEKLHLMDESLRPDRNVYAHRLCGAGNGGYFFVITRKGHSLKNAIEIDIDHLGLQGYSI